MSELLRPRGERSLGEVSNILKARMINPNEQQFEFQIPVDRYPISAAELRGLTELPYEVALTESKGKVILNTGLDHGMRNEERFRERRDNSRLSLHTHPKRTDGSMDVNAPSLPDVYVTQFASDKTPLLLVHPKGIMVYSAPNYNPMKNEEFKGEARDMMLLFGEAQGIDTYFWGESTTLRRFTDLSWDEMVKFERQLAEETHMIEQEALWDNPEGLQGILDIVNLRAA